MKSGRKHCFQKVDGKIVKMEDEAPSKPTTTQIRPTIQTMEIIEKPTSRDSLRPVFSFDNRTNTNRDHTGY